jgi:hypothetical protein
MQREDLPRRHHQGTCSASGAAAKARGWLVHHSWRIADHKGAGRSLTYRGTTIRGRF